MLWDELSLIFGKAIHIEDPNSVAKTIQDDQENESEILDLYNCLGQQAHEECSSIEESHPIEELVEQE